MRAFGWLICAVVVVRVKAGNKDKDKQGKKQEEESFEEDDSKKGDKKDSQGAKQVSQPNQNGQGSAKSKGGESHPTTDNLWGENLFGQAKGTQGVWWNIGKLDQQALTIKPSQQSWDSFSAERAGQGSIALSQRSPFLQTSVISRPRPQNRAPQRSQAILQSSAEGLQQNQNSQQVKQSKNNLQKPKMQTVLQTQFAPQQTLSPKPTRKSKRSNAQILRSSVHSLSQSTQTLTSRPLPPLPVPPHLSFLNQPPPQFPPKPFVPPRKSQKLLSSSSQISNPSQTQPVTLSYQQLEQILKASQALAKLSRGSPKEEKQRSSRSNSRDSRDSKRYQKQKEGQSEGSLMKQVSKSEIKPSKTTLTISITLQSKGQTETQSKQSADSMSLNSESSAIVSTQRRSQSDSLLAKNQEHHQQQARSKSQGFLQSLFGRQLSSVSHTSIQQLEGGRRSPSTTQGKAPKAAAKSKGRTGHR